MHLKVAVLWILWTGPVLRGFPFSRDRGVGEDDGEMYRAEHRAILEENQQKTLDFRLVEDGVKMNTLI